MRHLEKEISGIPKQTSVSRSRGSGTSHASSFAKDSGARGSGIDNTTQHLNEMKAYFLKLRSRVISVARRPRSSWLTAANFIPTPVFDRTYFTTASARIWPSCTRKWRCTTLPSGLTLGVLRKIPPMLISCTGETSAIPAQFQYTHTFSEVSTREQRRLVGRLPSCP